MLPWPSLWPFSLLKFNTSSQIIYSAIPDWFIMQKIDVDSGQRQKRLALGPSKDCYMVLRCGEANKTPLGSSDQVCTAFNIKKRWLRHEKKKVFESWAVRDHQLFLLRNVHESSLVVIFLPVVCFTWGEQGTRLHRTVRNKKVTTVDLYNSGQYGSSNTGVSNHANDGWSRS